MTEASRIQEQAETPARFSVDEFMQMVNSDVFQGAGKLELVDGVIVRMAPAQAPHMRYQRQIFLALHGCFAGNEDGLIVQFELSLVLREATLRDADVGVIKDFSDVEKFPDPATVLLVVEIAHSSLDKDLTAKRGDYARAEIPNYWVVDVEGRRTHVMKTPLDGDYAERRLISFGDALAVPGTNKTIVID